MRASIKMRELVQLQDATDARILVGLVAVPTPSKPVHTRVL